MIVSKQLNIKIEKCKDCPFCKHDKWLYGWVCNKYKMWMCHENKELLIPEWCELPTINTFEKK